MSRARFEALAKVASALVDDIDVLAVDEPELAHELRVAVAHRLQTAEQVHALSEQIEP
jgi:hypothetical protein